MHRGSIIMRRYSQVSSVDPTKSILVREFVQDALYNKTGYFNKEKLIISTPPIRFNELENELDYRRRAHEVFQAPGDWVTPTEIFKPWYGRAIGKMILEKWRQRKEQGAPLRVFEIGGGNGTMADNILSYIAEEDAQTYVTMNYNIVEISHQLAEVQRNNLEAHGERATVHEKSFLDWDETIGDDAFVCAFEVLDNLPHDLVVYEDGLPLEVRLRPNGTALPNGWEVVEGRHQTGQRGVLYRHEITRATRTTPPPGPLAYTEDYGEITDPLLAECFELYNGHAVEERPIFDTGRLLSTMNRAMSSMMTTVGEQDRVFLPTGSLALLKVLSSHFPSHSVVMSDFSHLRGALADRNGPLVQRKDISKDGYGTMISVDDYLSYPGQCDIMFPTDFAKLSRMYGAVCGKQATVLSHSDTMLKYGDLEQTQTISGYNPLVQDFKNVSFIVSDFDR